MLASAPAPSPPCSAHWCELLCSHRTVCTAAKDPLVHWLTRGVSQRGRQVGGEGSGERDPGISTCSLSVGCGWLQHLSISSPLQPQTSLRLPVTTPSPCLPGPVSPSPSPPTSLRKVPSLNSSLPSQVEVSLPSTLRRIHLSVVQFRHSCH